MSRLMSADILIVDDNVVNVELLENLLEDAGYDQLEGISDPFHAETRIQQRCPDLILLDIRMPGMNGLELMERVKAHLGEAMPAVIFLTAQIDERTRYQALSLGAQDFITKPFDHTEVLQRMGNVLQQRLLLRERSEKADLMEQLVAQRTAELHRQAREEPVTGLPNRRALIEILERQLQHSGPVGVLFLALEGLESCARLHGYGVADRLAQALAARFREEARPGAMITGVWNSHEWLMLIPRWSGQDQAEVCLDKVLAQFRKPFLVDGLKLKLGVRVGVSTSEAGSDAEQLIRMSALALPEAAGQWQCYDAQLEQRLQHRQIMQDELVEALKHDEFQLVYQPKVDLLSGHLSGAEALLRWHNKRLGSISPVEFIPLAEAGGEIVDIGDWVQQEALSRLKDWYQQDRVDQTFTLAFNVSSVQLMQPDFADNLVHRIMALQLPPGMVEVEVTESGLLENVDLARAQLKTLADAGVGIAIDDFGTGYSSLSYLKSLPVTVLKIDRAFIRELHLSKQDQRLAETVIDMARHFECKTVAEGVDQIEQLDMLRQMGCDQVQGFLLSPPLKEEAFLRLAALGFDHLF